MREYEKEPNVDSEATVVRPFFTEDAAEGARPVVPLDDRAVVEDVGAYVETGTAPHAYTRAWKRRTHWTTALVAAALLVGTIVGVAGLRLYQRSRTADAQKTPAPEQPSEAAVTSPSAPAPSPEASKAPVLMPTPAPEAAAAAATPAAPVKAAAARTSEEDERAEAAPARRSKKGDDDEEVKPVAERPRRVGRDGPPPVYDTQGPAPEGSAAERRAEREEARLRRAERQMRRAQRRRERRGDAYMVDSIRGVFEGRRESPPR